MTPSENNKKSKNGVLYAIIGILIIVIIILLCMRSCRTDTPAIDTPTPEGTYEIGDKQDKPEKEEVEKHVDSISFAGAGSAEISSEWPNAEFFNPEKNIVDMVFTITDDATGEVIAVTDKVAPGKYAYVNMYEHFKTPGEYTIHVAISAFMQSDGSPANGVNQKMIINVVED